MAQGQQAPVVEIFIHDEATSALDRIRQKMRSSEMRQAFRGIADGLKGLEEAARAIEREIGSIARVTGASAFLGGGLVMGLTKLAQSLDVLARSSLQNRYLAQSLGITSEKLTELIDRGKALGLSTEQAKHGVVSLINGLEELRIYGQHSHVWQALAKGKGGVQLAADLQAAVTGPGGIDAGMKMLADRTGRMKPEGQRYISEVFGTGTTAFKDLFKFKQGELVQAVELSAPAARAYALAMTNLGRSWENTKTTLAAGVMPAFEGLVRQVDLFLQGPGGKIVKQFADWVASLNIDWNKLALDFVAGMKQLKTVFDWVWWAFQKLDPIVQAMGGWTPIIAGLAVAVGVGGLATAITALASSLALIGRLGWVVGALAAVAVFSATPAKGAETPGTAPPAGAPGGGRRRSSGQWHRSGGSGGAVGTPAGTLDLDEIQVRPQRYQAPGGAETPRIIRASFSPGGDRGGGYSDRDLEEKAEDTAELRKLVKATQDEVAQLASYIAQNVALSDDSGAGGLAAIGGALRAPGGVSGGVGGGSGGTFGRGRGVGPGRGPALGPRGGPTTRSTSPTEIADVTSGVQGNDYLKDERASRIAEINSNPATKLLLMQMLDTESGTKGYAPVATLEALFNRSKMVGNTIAQELRSGFYGPIKHGVAQHRILSPAQVAVYERIIAAVAKGSNLIKGRTDQGSGNDPNVNGPGRVIVPGTREVYNFWKGRRGGRDYTHEDARRFAERQQDQVRQSQPGSSAPVTSSDAPAPNVTTLPEVKVEPGRRTGAASTPGGPGGDRPTTAGEAGIVPKFNTGGKNWQMLDASFVQSLNRAYDAMPAEIRDSFKLTSGYRSVAEQAEIYRRSGGGRLFAAAPPGRSRHQFGTAVDVARGAALIWLQQHGYEYGLTGILGGLRGRDPVHIQLRGAPTAVREAVEDMQRRVAVTREAEARSKKAAEESESFQKTFERWHPRKRVPITVRVRGPRGVVSSAEGAGDVHPTVEREISHDPALDS